MPLIRTSNTDLVRIELPAADEWVEVKRALGKDDERTVQFRLLSGNQVDPARLKAIAADPKLDMGALVDAATFATLEVAIKRWSFEEPVTPENIRALDDDSLEVIKQRLNELYPGPRTDDERKNSSGGGAASTSDGEQPRLSSPG